MSKKKKASGANGFGKDYWQKNYSEPNLMDGIGNASEHAKYLKSFLELEDVEIHSLIDLGFGMGHLFKEMVKAVRPLNAFGIEPSEHIFEKILKQRVLEKFPCKTQIENLDLLSWAKKGGKYNKVYDLGICTSVCQYLEAQELEEILPILSKRVKYLYLTVPTDRELEVQVSDLHFRDIYALRRSRDFYQQMFSSHFTFISSRILESRYFFEESNSAFSDFLFRF